MNTNQAHTAQVELQHPAQMSSSRHHTGVEEARTKGDGDCAPGLDHAEAREPTSTTPAPLIASCFKAMRASFA